MNGSESWIRAHVHREPDVAAVARREHDAAFTRSPAVCFVSKENRIKIGRDERVLRGPRFAAIVCLQNRPAVPDNYCILFGSKRDAGQRGISHAFYGCPLSATI